MSSNIDRLGSLIASRMKKTSSAAVPTAIELGVINANLSLTTDSLPVAIPKGDYMINLLMTGGGGPDLPSSFRSLRSGDRVVVAWCGNEPVVIAIVVSS